jgi:hypothetical protein
MVASPFLFSANPLVKFHIAKNYLGDRHHVWCSDCFDCRHHYLHSGPIDTPPSSNPGEIFERLRAATVDRVDWHEPSIATWKVTIKALTVRWRTSGVIDNDVEQEIIFLLDRADIGQWRPLIYIIQRDKVEARLQRVPLRDRASLVMEYVIEDLHPDEFDVIGP